MNGEIKISKKVRFFWYETQGYHFTFGRIVSANYAGIRFNLFKILFVFEITK